MTTKFEGMSSAGKIILFCLLLVIVFFVIFGIPRYYFSEKEITSPKAFLGVEYSSRPYVKSVVKGSAAEKAGLKRGDIIYGIFIGSDWDEFGLKPETNLKKVFKKNNIKPGDIVELTIFRDGEKINLKVKLGVRPKNIEIKK